MLDWIKNIFKRDKKKVGVRVEPSKPWPRSVEHDEQYNIKITGDESFLPPTPPHKAHLLHTRKNISSKYHNQQTNNDDNFILGVVVGAATNNAALGGMASGSVTGGLVGDVMNDGCLGDCDSGSSCDCGGSCGD